MEEAAREPPVAPQASDSMAAREPPVAPQASDSMAARLARQRQQRSVLRTSVDTETAGRAGAVGSELQILRAELTTSGHTVSALQQTLKESEADIEDLGQDTARLAVELKQMQALVVQKQDAAPKPMAVSIDLDASGQLSVRVGVAEEGAQ